MKNIVFCIVVCISYSSCDVVTNQLEQKLNQKIELLDSTKCWDKQSNKTWFNNRKRKNEAWYDIENERKNIGTIR